MEEQPETQATDHVQLAADIVSTYVANNSLPITELAALVSTVHAALVGLGKVAATEVVPEKPTAAQIRKSISPDALISFEDGKPYKTLRRHLTIRGLTREAYRAKWGLPVDYPMTAPSYSAKRSEMARNAGLGQQPRKDAAPKATAVAETVSETPMTRVWSSKAAEACKAPPKARRRKKVAEPA